MLPRSPAELAPIPPPAGPEELAGSQYLISALPSSPVELALIPPPAGPEELAGSQYLISANKY